MLTYVIDILKQLVRRRADIKLQPSGCNFPYAYVASYNEYSTHTAAIQ